MSDGSESAMVNQYVSVVSQCGWSIGVSGDSVCMVSQCVW